MIVSASRRTDLPASHARWLAERVRTGFVEVANPFNPAQIRTVDLTPAPQGSMEALVLWTRNPAPLLNEIVKWEARGIRSLWLVTVTGYPKALEKGTPAAEEVAATLAELAQMVGRERIYWRYDPIFTSDALGMDAGWHRENFWALAEVLSPSVAGVIISLYDDYAAARRRLKEAGIDFNADEARKAATEVATICRELSLPVQSCCEDLNGFGVEQRGCIDRDVLSSIWGIEGLKRDANQRKDCLCAQSTDIGTYGTCAHGCLYCYATR